MADDFKALVALTKETNAKLDLLHRQGVDNDSPRERILDAAPEILSMERVMKKEKAQREKIHKEDQKNRDKGEKSTVQSVKETAKETSEPIVQEVKKSTVLAKITSTAITDQTETFKPIALSLGKLGNFEPYLETGLKDSKSFKEILGSIVEYIDKPLSRQQGKEDSRSAEDKAKSDKRQDKMNKIFSSMNDSLKGMARAGFDKIKSGFSGLAKFALGGLALAALAFLNDPKFQAMAFQFTEYIIPKLVWIYDNVIKPMGNALKDFVDDLDAVFKGEKGIYDLINENVAVVTGLTALLAPGLFFGALKIGVGVMSKAIGLAFSSEFLKAPVVSKAIGIGLIVSGLIGAFKNGAEAWAKTGDVSKTVSAALSGTGKGMGNALENAGTWAKILGGAGFFIFGPIGAAIGAAMGAVVGGILGYFGADAIDKAINSIGDDIQELIDSTASFFSDFFTSIILGTKKLFGKGLTKAEQKKNETAKFRVSKAIDRDFSATGKIAAAIIDYPNQVANFLFGTKLGKVSTMIGIGKGVDPKFNDPNLYARTKADREEIARALQQVNANKVALGGKMNELDRDDLDNAIVMNSGNTVIAPTTNSTTLVNGINITTSDPFINSFAKANDYSFPW